MPKPFFLAAALLWTLLIAVLCLVSFNELPNIGIANADKGVHTIFHCVFIVLWYAYLRKDTSDLDKILLRIFPASVIYGIGIEIAQELFTKTRHADIYDVIANTTGAFIGVSIIMIVNFYLKRKKH